jgi:UDPglucose--hexose-1-phosphate uridylyltransferase
VSLGLPELDPKCVFCPGNEPSNVEILRTPKGSEWQLRVIENKFHALEHSVMYRHKDFYNSIAGHGNHEVVITRKHNEPVAMQSIETIKASLGLFQDRILEISKDEKIAYVQAFHNHGRDAGGSLVHPHYQIIAVPIIPPHIHSEINGAYHHFDTYSTCIYCDIIKEELTVKDRVVYEDEHFVVISAYASRKPFETWILPKIHGARFEEADAKQKEHLAFVLKSVLSKLYIKLSDPPLNYYFHSYPKIKNKHTLMEEGSYHWHLTIFPRITIWGGFEYATGIPINPVAPEQTAEFLRE